MMEFDTTGQGAAITHRARAVVYDRKTGRIVHVHQIVTFDGAPPPDDGVTATRALELARMITRGKRDVASTRLVALETATDGPLDAATHKVDPKTGRLKAIVQKGRR